MSYIIISACKGVCDTACVDVCPVDCIHGPIDKDGMGAEVAAMSEEEKKDKQLFIDPDVCIDCGACLPECPVDAITESEEEALDKDEKEAVQENYSFFGHDVPERYK